jgi:hypothetical protein
MTPLSDEQFEMLLERLFVDALSEDDQQTLAATISARPEAMRRYVETVHLSEGLPYLLGGETGGPRERPQPAETIDAVPAEQASIRNAAASTTPRTRDEAALAPAPSLRIPSWAAAASIAFVAGAALAAAAYRWATSEAQVADGADVAAVRAVTAAPTAPFAQENWLGRISGLSLEASTDGLLEAMQVGQQLRCGEVVQLSRGFMRVTLHSGPELIVEGPAEFSLVSEAGLFLRSGRIAVRGQRQFVVQTPLVTAECLSADASFDAAGDDSASVYVDSGVATLFTTAQEGVGSEQLQVLRQGEGLLVQARREPQRPLTTSARGPIPSIVRRWSDVESRLSKYQRLVLDDRPVAYWPLERVRKNRRVLDLTQNGHDGWPVGNWPAEPDAERGTYFNGECYIEPDRKPPIDPRTGYSVEGWAKVDGGPEYQSIFTSRWVLKSHEPDCQMFGFTLYAGAGDTWELWTGSGRKGQLWQRLISDVKVDRTNWVHVAATFEASGPQTAEDVEGVVRLYVNGELVAQDAHQESLTDFEWPARIGAAEFVPRYLTSWLFEGRLRDVAVYDYPLEATQLAKHFATGAAAEGGEISHKDRGTELLLAVVTGERGR